MEKEPKFFTCLDPNPIDQWWNAKQNKQKQKKQTNNMTKDVTAPQDSWHLLQMTCQVPQDNLKCMMTLLFYVAPV